VAFDLSGHRAVGVSAGSPDRKVGPPTLQLCAQTAGLELWAQKINIILPFLTGDAPGKDAEYAKIDHSEHIPAQIAQVTVTLLVQESLRVPAVPPESLGKPLSRAPVSK
jgi:hypothetical protein